MKIRTFAILVFLLFAASVWAQTPATAQAPEAAFPDDPSSLLSLTLKDAWNRFGPPARLVAVRGDEPWQDDVAFEYQAGFSLFWYRERLWQIRLSKGYSGSCFGIFLGDTQDKALSLLGQPSKAPEGFMEWRLPYRGYPVHLRILTQGGVISEIYIYRSDF
jgi:hypothetical protein